MLARLGKKEKIAIWVLILLLGVAAGAWRVRRVKLRVREECGTLAGAFAAALDRDQLASLVGAQARPGDPIYRAVTVRLARLQGADPRVRWIFLLRPGPAPGKFTYLAGSMQGLAPGSLQPGDDVGDPARSLALQRTAQSGLTSADGPIGGLTESLFVGYAATAGPADEILGVEIWVSDWTSRLWGEVFPFGLYVWLLLGLPFGAFLAMRGMQLQRDALRNLSEAMEQSQSAVLIIAESGRIEYVNAGFCQQMGYSRRELIGRKWRDLRVVDSAAEIIAEIRATVRSGKTWQGEWTNARKSGGQYPARGSITPVKRRDGSNACYVAVFEDMTPIKNNEEALRKAVERAESGERTKALFIATMSHEVRTPLNGIVGFTSLLLDTPLTPEQREYVQTVRSSGAALVQLTSDILDFARIEAGTLKLDVRQANARSVVEDALDLFGVAAANKDIELLHWVDDNVPAVLKLDDARLRQVLVNLVSNAVKFTEKGYVEVGLRAEQPALGDSGLWKLKFSVRDTGIGIAPEDQVRLFKPFTQVDESNARRFGGSGLGLSISRNLVQLMGGEISVESVPGQGSVFSFTVPTEAGASVSRSLPDLGALNVVLCAAAGPFRDEFSRLAQRWRLTMTVITQASGRNPGPSEIAFVELGFERARRLAAEPAGTLPWPSERAYALVPMSLENSVRSALRVHFCRLINKPIHHDAMLGLLAGIRLPQASEKAGPREFGLNVLVVEDNPVNQRLVQKLLFNLGCRTTVAATAALASMHSSTRRPRSTWSSWTFTCPNSTDRVRSSRSGAEKPAGRPPLSGSRSSPPMADRSRRKI